MMNFQRKEMIHRNKNSKLIISSIGKPIPKKAMSLTSEGGICGACEYNIDAEECISDSFIQLEDEISNLYGHRTPMNNLLQIYKYLIVLGRIL